MAFLGLIALVLTIFLLTDSKDINTRNCSLSRAFSDERHPMLKTDRVGADVMINKSDHTSQLDHDCEVNP